MIIKLFKEFLVKYSEFGIDIGGPMIFGPIWPFVKPGVSAALKILENKIGEFKTSDEKYKEAFKELEKDEHLKGLVLSALNESFKELSDDHFEILAILNRIEQKIDKTDAENIQKGKVSPKEYALKIRPLFERRAFDPDIQKYTHGIPFEWREALNDTRRALVTGIWKDREGNILGVIPAISSCPAEFLSLIQAVERALAYCIADLDVELKMAPEQWTYEITNFQLCPSLENNWIQIIGLDLDKARTRTLSYSIEEILKAIIHQLNIQVFLKLGISALSEEKFSPIHYSVEYVRKAIYSSDREGYDLARQKCFYARQLSKVENDKSLWEESIRYYLEALSYFKLQDDNKNKVASAITFTRLGEIVTKFHDKDYCKRATEYYDEAIKIYADLDYQYDAKYVTKVKNQITTLSSKSI